MPEICQELRSFVDVINHFIEKKNQNISWEKKTPYIKTTDNNNARVKVKCQNSICLQKQEEEFK